MISLINSLFNNHSKTENFENNLLVDVHSHLIPGVDDGSKAMFHSLKYISAMKELGYKKLIITPHIMSHRYKNSSKTILDKLEMLKDAVTDHEIDIELEAASEYYLDDYFLNLLEEGDILTFHKNYVLFEMSYTRAPVDLEGVVFNMILKGYTPVLAHPERYVHMHNDFKKYEDLKSQGVLFQLNINSLGGFYSKKVQKVAEKLVNRGMIDFLGSDAHKMEHIDSLKNVLQSPKMKKVFEKNKILNNKLL